MVAAGSQSGVAPLANLLLTEQQATVFKVSTTEPDSGREIEKQNFRFRAIVESLRHVTFLLDQDCPVDVYAPGYGILSHDLKTGSGPVMKKGTCFSVSLTAGLAAYFLAHPDYQDRLKYSPTDTKSNSIGMRMKKLFTELAYQRVLNDEKLVREHLAEYPSEIPVLVDVLYNNFHGPQK
ncbi:hypothetical protein B0H67DRAFT_548760 [Lasiosphaeris hirsuta]|uniref:Uncharacterized protein n=1 Tax=Lasiosphaeris hirsuta TaxID=260670 RepID=A0AA40E7A6_9PEZI|nr:hypothetical protein B0H67DRAFT_548760 [Lasiosphaeris hirsuta]